MYNYFYNWVYGEEEKESKNMYDDLFYDILIKRRDKILSTYNIINTYSLNTKKRTEDIMLDKLFLTKTFNKMKNIDGIVCYYYCKGNKLYQLFEYSLTPSIRKSFTENDVHINDIIDSQFALDITIDIIRDALNFPKKYIEFDPKKNKIGELSIFEELILHNEDKLFVELMERFKIRVSDNIVGCGCKYQELLNLAIRLNNGNIVNVLNKCYYEPKILNSDKMTFDLVITEDTEMVKKYKKYKKIAEEIAPLLYIGAIPFIFYNAIYVSFC
ncbi:hypothetical protein BMW23_0661 [Bodo saltans virus]|uniref:Uncharacterized protein n=1 Tax=Bodo saltans virus TaxID=2024608 RepID=A0A2H4UV18_9VIRU|nr:hypothetical protein QJ851_gp0644 [Bodo saltans virus]ATZ80707.1 hypothetical protein BMW23_0661 [Bodo saltans virus]